MTRKYVLITGCSEGGLATSMIKAYLRRNYTVLATLRNTSKAGSLHKTENVQVLQLDITSSESIKQCVEGVKAITGGTLDVLVNNAAVAQVMPLLDFSIEEAKRHFDTNVWGLLAMVQAFAPLLIKAQGVVCNISSVLGEMVYAWQGIYGSSKAAVTLISETLRVEMAPLGVRVVVVALGGVSTFQNDPKNRPDLVLPVGSYYEPIYAAINRHQKSLIFEKKQDADVATENITNDVLGGRKAIIRRGEGSIMAWLGNTFLTHEQFITMLNKESGLDGLKPAEKQ